MDHDSLEQARSQLVKELEGSSDQEHSLEGCRRLVDLDRQLLQIATLQSTSAAQNCATESLGNSLTNLAIYLIDFDQLDEADQHCREASVTFERRFGAQHWGVREATAILRTIERIRQLEPELQQLRKSAEHLFLEARNLEESEHFAEAARRLQQAADLERVVLGANHLRCGQTLNWHARLLERLEQHEEAAQLYGRGNSILLEQLGETHPAYIDNIKSQAFTLRKLERYHESVGLLERALAGNEKNYGETSHAYFIGLLQLAIGYNHMQSFDKSLALLQKALELAGDLDGPTSPAYARSQREMAKVLERLGRWEEAERQFLDALDTCRSQGECAEINTGYRDCAQETAAFYGRANKWPLAHKVLLDLRQYLEDLQRPPGTKPEEYGPSNPAVLQWTIENQDFILEAMRESHELDMLLVWADAPQRLPEATLVRVEREMLWRMEAFAEIIEVRGGDSGAKMREIRDRFHKEFQERRQNHLTDL